jgi:hypothetical protein
MRNFAVKAGGKTFYCDTDGLVSDSGNVIGKWTTAANQIRITPTAGPPVNVPVEWRFNEHNQLTIRHGGSDVFTVVATADGLPRFSLDKNVLMVDPDGDEDFEFPLECRWGLDKSGSLKVTIGAVASTLDGYIEDPEGRLRFRFYDRQFANFPSSLVFAGEWERIPANTTEIRLHFKLNDPALEDPAFPLNLPAAVQVDPRKNHLALVYQSGSYGERRLEFQGSVQIRPNWTLVFKIANSHDGATRKTSIDVETTFAWDHANGTLKLHVGRTTSTNAQVLEVSGRLQAQLKQGTLTWSFAYRNATAGGQTTLTFATALTFTTKNGNIHIAYTQAGQTKVLDVQGKLVQSDFVLSGGVQIKSDPQGRRIGVFVGVTF